MRETECENEFLIVGDVHVYRLTSELLMQQLKSWMQQIVLRMNESRDVVVTFL